MVDDEEIMELVEMEVRELLAAQEFDEDARSSDLGAQGARGRREGSSRSRTSWSRRRLGPDPERETDKPFLMPVEDVFTITGRGTVVTGRVERGEINVNEEVEIVGIRPPAKTTVTGIEMFRKLLDEGQAGDNVGLLLRGTKREDVERGQVVVAPGTTTPHTSSRPGLHPVQGRGRPSHAVLQQLPSAVLLPHHGRPALSRCPRAPRWSCPATTPTCWSS